MPNPFSKLISPWYPATAIGLEKGFASMVHLERSRGKTCTLRHAATIALAESVLRPSFEQRNIVEPTELAAALNDLASSTGLLRQKRWSVSLPEAATRSLILTLESRVGSQSELEEVLGWKMERGFAVPLEELLISREKLRKDAQGRDRYLATAIKGSVIEEYEVIFNSLGWRPGMILPRHFGESQWLIRNGSGGDALLLSSSDEGFTAVVFREREPLILRAITCERHEREDELYRLLLFYRDRRANDRGEGGVPLSRLLVIGEGFTKQRANEIVNETLGSDLRALDPEDVGLEIPARKLSFDLIAAPAGLATLSWQ